MDFEPTTKGEQYVSEREHKIAESSTLYGGWLTRYQHVERLGNEEVSGLLDGEVIIQEKIDGSNLTVAYDIDADDVIICSRGRCLYASGLAYDAFRGAVTYVLNHPGILPMLRGVYNENHEQWILRGEWLVKHTLLYDKESYGKFYVFDVQSQFSNGCEYVHYDDYNVKLTHYAVELLPVLATLTNPTPEQIIPFSIGKSAYGPNDREGIVVKRYDFKNIYGRTTWGKMVTADFKQKHKLNGGANKKDGPELRFASFFVCQAIVLKEIEKIKDDHEGFIHIKSMPEVMGRVWHALFHEELWNFIKKEKVKEFDFKVAEKQVYAAVREIALAYFNGCLENSVEFGGKTRDKIRGGVGYPMVQEMVQEIVLPNDNPKWVELVKHLKPSNGEGC